MLTITSDQKNVLTISSNAQEFTSRVMPGAASSIATSSGSLIRVINDVQGPISFSAVALADAQISEDQQTVTFQSNPDWVHVSFQGDKFIF